MKSPLAEDKRSRKLWFFILCLIFCSCLLSVAYSAVPAKPNPPRLVNDFANLLTPSQQDELESKLTAYDKQTSTQIVVVSIDSLGGSEISDYAVQLGHEWGVGQKGQANGIIVLIAKNDRKMFIATGYGTESILTDALSKRIVEEDLKPFFKQGDFYGGINQATDKIMLILDGKFVPTVAQDNKMDLGDWLLLIFLSIFFLFVIGQSFFDKSSRGYGSRNRNSGFWVGGGGGSSGSSWNDFSSGSGGFGGFGGGDFGGGGAGGSW